MNVIPGQYYGFMDIRQAELQQQAFRNVGANACLQSLANCYEQNLIGMNNAIIDPYRMTYFEQRYGIGRVWEDVT